MPSLDVPWTPPSVVAGDAHALGDALAAHGKVGVQLGARLSGSRRASEILAALDALAPGTTFELRGRRSIADVLATALPLERAPGDRGAAPRWEAAAVRLAEGWNAGRESTGDAEALLVIDDA